MYTYIHTDICTDAKLVEELQEEQEEELVTTPERKTGVERGLKEFRVWG